MPLVVGDKSIMLLQKVDLNVISDSEGMVEPHVGNIVWSSFYRRHLLCTGGGH